MGKKNPYITTIGFDRTDPRHVQVAELLNSMTRKKAQYIVDAILAYECRKENGEVPMRLSGIEYDQIKAMVRQVLAEQGMSYGGSPERVVSVKRNAEAEPPGKPGGGIDIDEDALDGIMQSLEAFREFVEY